MAAALQTQTQQQAAVAPTGAALYARFALAGAISCGFTHGSLTPVERQMFAHDVIFAFATLSPYNHKQVELTFTDKTTTTTTTNDYK